MYSTVTNTTTYTIVDIRKTFEGFSADFRMIAIKTGKRSNQDVENCLHDILVWAENKYLKSVDITLLDANNKPLRASRYSVEENGTAIQSERAGSNDWPNIPGTYLAIIVTTKDSWDKMTELEKENFKKSNDFKKPWGPSSIDNSYTHLSKDSAQLYASKGYELQKENFK